MTSSLHDGIPSAADYKALLESSGFKEMENFSRVFIETNKAILHQFLKWSDKNALYSWSRQWEYPYVFDKIAGEVGGDTRVRILDAGSGITFFPYLLRDKFTNVDVFCCDYSKGLSDIFTRLNEKQKTSIEFSTADLRKLPYCDAFFDIAYCISVLEHTADYETIIAEFHRVVRPGGMLILTFDISLDGTLDIGVDGAAKLLGLLAQRFQCGAMDVRSLLSGREIWTTIHARKLSPALLPWRIPLLTYIKNCINNRRLVSWPPPLTFFCLSLKRP